MNARYILVFSTLLALPLSSANADALLFPYVVTSNSVATIISVVNRDPSGALFLEYFHKITLAHDSECNSTGRRAIDSAQNDLVSFEVNNTFTGSIVGTLGGPLFNDPAMTPTYAGNDFTMTVPKPKRAFLIVDDNDNDGPDLYGEAVIIETVSGAAWGYRAYNPRDNFQTLPEFDALLGFATNNDLSGEALDVTNGTDEAAVTLLPGSEWVTRLFVTPLEDTNQRLCANCSVTIRLTRDTNGATPGLFDRDTTPLAGSDTVNVVCVSGVDIGDLLPASVEAIFNQQGGWGFADIGVGLTTTEQGTTTNTENAAVVMKLEFNKTGTQHISPNISNGFAGIVNTAVWLRNRDNGNTF